MSDTDLMNIDTVIFDPGEQDDGSKTINGIPAGYLSPNYPRIVDEEGEETASIDISRIVEHFHGNLEETEKLCPYTGLPVDGLNVIDGNSQNFLITNLEQVSKKSLEVVPFMPKVEIRKTIELPTYDLEIEISGLPNFRASGVLDNLKKEGIPDIPENIKFLHEEIQLIWLWNELTKVRLLKGLKSLKRTYRATQTSVKLTNQAVLEFCFKALHADINTDTKEQ